jgi:tRNA G18 (ribose-2'-O)-methylase SpoU
MKSRFRKLTPAELNRPGIEDFRKSEKLPVIVVLDNIRSLHNVGSIFRTCDAFNISEIFLSGFTARPPHREIHKTALGATESVKWRYFSTASETIEELKSVDAFIAPVEQCHNSNLVQSANRGEKLLALVFGNEVDGVSQEFMDAADIVLEIPQAGTKHSLNVAVAAGIAIWECFRK